MSKLLATLQRLQASSASTPEPKLAEAVPTVSAPSAPSGFRELLKQAANTLRAAQGAEVRDEDLYAVLEPPADLPGLVAPSGDDSSHLRKLAHALRVADRDLTALRHEKAADLLLSARGLMLLDEQTRSR